LKVSISLIPILDNGFKKFSDRFPPSLSNIKFPSKPTSSAKIIPSTIIKGYVEVPTLFPLSGVIEPCPRILILTASPSSGPVSIKTSAT
jgi:hypothetical protein